MMALRADGFSPEPKLPTTSTHNHTAASIRFKIMIMDGDNDPGNDGVTQLQKAGNNANSKA